MKVLSAVVLCVLLLLTLKHSYDINQGKKKKKPWVIGIGKTFHITIVPQLIHQSTIRQLFCITSVMFNKYVNEVLSD